MSSYRCPQCNLSNWMSDGFCKRCKLPNPYLPQNNQANSFDNPSDFVQNAPVKNFSPDQPPAEMQTPFIASASVNQPPPPPSPTYQPQFAAQTNVYTNNRVPNNGNNGAYNSGNHRPYSRDFNSPNYAPGQNHQQPSYQYSSSTTHTSYGTYESAAELLEAEKHVRYAAGAGLVWSLLLLIAFAALAVLSKSFVNDPKFPAEAMIMVIFVVGVMGILIGVLSYGVKKESTVCAVLLLIISVLGLISGLSEGKAGQILFAFVMVVFFIYGVKGTFVIKKYR